MTQAPATESAKDLDLLAARLREMAGARGHHVDDRRTWGRAAGALDTLRRELATAEQQATRTAFKEAAEWCQKQAFDLATGSVELHQHRKYQLASQERKMAQLQYAAATHFKELAK